MNVGSLLRRHPVAAFVLLAYGVSWTLWLGGLALYPPSLPAARRAPGQAISIAGTFGPLVAALVVARATGTWPALRARLLRWRVRPRWYAVAVGLPVAAVALAYAGHRLLGGAPVDAARALPLAALPVAFLFTLLAGGGNEEPGWRGFALPRLQDRYGAVVGTLLLAAAWAGWHLPAFLDPTSSQSLVPLGGWLVGVLGTSLVLTWLWNATGGSVPVAAAYHAAFNVAALWVISGLPTAAVAGFYWLGALAYLAAAVALAVATRGTLGHDAGAVGAGAAAGRRRRPEKAQP